MKTMICVDNLLYSEFNYAVMQEINNVVKDSNTEISLATLDQSIPMMSVNTAIFAAAEMDSFSDGVLITHNIKNARSILGCANNSKKVLYLYDLDWMFTPMFYYEVYDTLNSKDLTLILRSEDHIEPVKNLCGKEVDKILNRFTLEGLWNLL